MCVLIVLLWDMNPLLEASKCWKFLGSRGERNTLTGLCSSRATFCFSFLWGGGEELPECSFRVRRQLLCAGFPVQDVSAGVHLVRGSDCREEGNHQMLVSEQKMAGRGAWTALPVWTSLVPLALQWQVTDVLMPPIAWAALGNFSLCPSNRWCFP